MSLEKALEANTAEVARLADILEKQYVLAREALTKMDTGSKKEDAPRRGRPPKDDAKEDAKAEPEVTDDQIKEAFTGYITFDADKEVQGERKQKALKYLKSFGAEKTTDLKQADRRKALKWVEDRTAELEAEGAADADTDI